MSDAPVRPPGRAAVRPHPVFARVYSALAALGEHGDVGRLRTEVLSSATGRLLLVGAGPGHDLDHLPTGVSSVVAVEPEPTMRRRLARRGVRRSGRSAVPVEILDGVAEELPVPDSSVDAVALSFVLCSVTDPAAAVAEVTRVLRPGGSLHVFEHVAAPPGSALRRWQTRAAPLWRRCAGGCRPDRDSAAVLAGAGFDTGGMALRHVPGIPLVRPHLVGVARRAGP